jgi:hypothetical protein
MFRSQSKSKSLKVQRETVRILAVSQLASAQGGGFAQAQPGTMVYTEIVCPRPPQFDTINDVSQSAPGGCGPQLPSGSIIINPSYP